MTFIPKDPQFITRDQLAFQDGKAFSLILDVVSDTTASFFVRGFTKEGPFTYRAQVTGDFSLQTFSFAIPDMPIFAGVYLNEAAVSFAASFGTLHLGINSTRYSMLCQGIINELFGISWPHNPGQSSLQNTGFITYENTENPPANTEINYTVPANAIWEVLNASLTLATDANVADRTLEVRFSNPNGADYWRPSSATQQASETINYSIIPGGTSAVLLANSEHEIGFPANLFLSPGSTIKTVITNRQAGDNITFMSLMVRLHFLSTT